MSRLFFLFDFLVVIAALAFLAFMVVSCGHGYQPPGADLWKAL